MRIKEELASLRRVLAREKEYIRARERFIVGMQRVRGTFYGTPLPPPHRDGDVLDIPRMQRMREERTDKTS